MNETVGHYEHVANINNNIILNRRKRKKKKTNKQDKASERKSKGWERKFWCQSVREQIGFLVLHRNYLSDLFVPHMK